MRLFGHETRPMFRRRSPAGRRSTLPLVIVAGSIAVLSSASGHVLAAAPPQAPAAAPLSAPSVRAMLDQYCVTCHNDSIVRGEGEPPSLLVSQLRATGLTLDTVDVTDLSANAELWERVILKLRAGSMPPGGRPRPDVATYDAVASWLETEVDRAAAASPNPGRNHTVHRLNRMEYHNAIRDLFALDIDVTALLPGDETSDTGFDNNADFLTISTAHLERYMSAARKIARLATGLPPTGGSETFEMPLLMRQEDRQSEDLPLGSRGGIAIRHNFPADGEYLIKVRLGTNWQDYIRGMAKQNQLDVRVDGALVQRFTVGGEARGRPAPNTYTIAEYGDPEWEEYLHTADDHLEVRLSVEAGPRLVGVYFMRRVWEPEGILQPNMGGEVLARDEKYNENPTVKSVLIEGPFQISGSGDTPSRREIFVCHPESGAGEEACATTILSRLARRAYRRPVTAGEVETLLEFFETGRSSGGGFDAGIQLALERLLTDPDFLLRVEPDPAQVAPGQPYRLSDVEVASRLSFFLWSSIPDEALLDLAERGELTDPRILALQVRRMVADPRAETMVDNFAAQWLHLRSLADVQSVPAVFPGFDDNLIEAFQRETELFLTSTLREDRSVLDLLRADYTFVNERLARHYGIPGIYGSRFRRVTVPNTEQRGGLLGHGGLLALTSYPDRTSPVLRGKWLLDTILGAPPPQPPPDVPPLPASGEGGKTVSVRERLEQHRKNPVCAGCHAIIDPPGFALENFDALGAWRSVDEGGTPIDAMATMPSGVTIEGLSGLRALLLDQPEQFVGTVTEKLLAYALGRGLEYYDQPTVRRIVLDAAAEEYRWSSLILGIVESPAFLTRNTQAAD